MDDETRTYFEDMRRDLSGLRGEVTGLRGELSDFRGEVGRRFEALDQKADSRAAHTRSIEVLRDQMNTRFARVRVDLFDMQRARPTRRRPRR